MPRSRLVFPRRASRGAVLLSALAFALASGPAAAGPQAISGEDAARARDLYKRGRDEYIKGHLSQAYSLLIEAWGIQKSFDVAGNLALAEGQLTRYREAAEHATYALANFPVGGSDAQRKALQDVLADARTYVGVITFQVSADHAAVTVDGRPVGESPIAGEVFVEPGPHVVVATLPGCEPVHDSVRTDKGSTHLLTLTFTKCGTSTPPPVVVVPKPTGPDPVTVAGFITTGVGLGLGAAFAIVSKIKSGDADTAAMGVGTGATACATPSTGVHQPPRRAGQPRHLRQRRRVDLRGRGRGGGRHARLHVRGPTRPRSGRAGPSDGDPGGRQRIRRALGEGGVLMRLGERTSLLFVAVLVTCFCGGVAAAGCVIDWADDCGHDHGFPGCSGGRMASGVGGAGTGAGSSTTQSGGGGTTGGCSDASSCPPVPPGPCAALGTVTCTDHKCGITYTPGDAPSQVYGNCKTNVCDATGTLSAVPTVDGGNAFDDGNPCTDDVCMAGVSQNNPRALGTACVLLGMTGFCEVAPKNSDGPQFLCSQCDPGTPSTCAGTGTTCISGTCVPASCTDSSKDGTETDVDCGGLECLPCKNGLKCKKGSDCFSRVCPTGGPDANICQVPTCLDNVQNQDETDVDCGGSNCPPCPPTDTCSAPGDCSSGVCAPTSPPTPGAWDTCQAPTCFDGVQNGSETGVDCGGPLDGGGDGDGGAPCPPCAM